MEEAKCKMKYSYKDITMQDVEKLYSVPGAFALAMEKHQIEKVVVYFVKEMQVRSQYDRST